MEQDNEAELAALLEKENFEEIKKRAASDEVPEAKALEDEQAKVPEPDIRQIIQKAGLAQKLKLALFGNAVCRLLLIRESNKLISMGVLKNPRLQVSEIEDFSKNANIPEAVLRAIGQDAKWTRHTTVKRALIFNPKCPLDVSLTLAKFLTPPDLKLLSRSKNIPQALVGFAKKKLEHAERK